MMFSQESDHWCPLAREPPRRCGMLSNVRPLNQAAQAPAYAGRHALLSTNKDLIICVVGTHRYQEACAISQLYLLHQQQLFIPGRPPGPTQSGWSVVSTATEFQFRWNWGARCDLHVNYSPRAFRPIMAACPRNIAPKPRIRSHVEIKLLGGLAKA